MPPIPFRRQGIGDYEVTPLVSRLASDKTDLTSQKNVVCSMLYVSYNIVTPVLRTT